METSAQSFANDVDELVCFYTLHEGIGAYIEREINVVDDDGLLCSDGS